MLYTEAYVLVLMKRFLPHRQNMISLVYTQIELLICISFEKCSAPSTDYRTNAKWAFCTYICCLQVPHL